MQVIVSPQMAVLNADLMQRTTPSSETVAHDPLLSKPHQLATRLHSSIRHIQMCIESAFCKHAPRLKKDDISETKQSEPHPHKPSPPFPIPAIPHLHVV